MSSRFLAAARHGPGGGCAGLETAWVAVTGIQVGIPGDHRVTSARQRREQSSEPQGTLAAKAEAEPGRTTRQSRPVVLDSKKEGADGVCEKPKSNVLNPERGGLCKLMCHQGASKCTLLSTRSLRGRRAGMRRAQGQETRTSQPAEKLGRVSAWVPFPPEYMMLATALWSTWLMCHEH